VQYYTRGNTVRAAETLTTAPVSATLIVPERVPAGEKFTVEGDIPDYAQSKIMIVKPGTSTRIGSSEYGQALVRNGSVELTAPDEPGDYEVVYALGKGTVLTRNTIRVFAE